MIDSLPGGGEQHWLEPGAGIRLRMMRWRNGGAPRTLLIIPGRTEFIEKYCEVIAECLMRDLAVAILDMRNHGHSSRPLPNRQIHHLTDFAPMVSDIRLAGEHLAAAGFPVPLTLLGHSMGGHVALQVAHDHPVMVASLVLTAPMVAIRLGPGAPFLRLLIRTANRLGRAERYALSQHDWTGGPGRVILQALLTSDDARFERETKFLEADPDLRLGGVSWGWLDAALRATARLESPGFAKDITAPALFVLSGADRVVDNGRARALATRMPSARIVEIAFARHEILMERDTLRAQFWTAFDSFMASKDSGD